jgi:hypothetical protein
MRRHSEGWLVSMLECTSGSDGLTVVVRTNLTVVYSKSAATYNTAVSQHRWWFSATLAGRQELRILLKNN